MADARNDVIMCLFDASGALPAESTSVLNPDDTLTKSVFQTGKFFEVESFTVPLKLRDDDKAGGGAGGGGRDYEAWRAAKVNTVGGKQLFFVLPDELTVVRDMDIASPSLLKNCLTGVVLTKGVLVKRGRNAAGDLLGFMKMEFENLRIRAVDWSEDEPIRETCKFKYNKLTITYIKRKADGSTLASVNATWSAQAAAKK